MATYGGLGIDALRRNATAQRPPAGVVAPGTMVNTVAAPGGTYAPAPTPSPPRTTVAPPRTGGRPGGLVTTNPQQYESPQQRAARLAAETAERLLPAQTNLTLAQIEQARRQATRVEPSQSPLALARDTTQAEIARLQALRNAGFGTDGGGAGPSVGGQAAAVTGRVGSVAPDTTQATVDQREWELRLQREAAEARRVEQEREAGYVTGAAREAAGYRTAEQERELAAAAAARGETAGYRTAEQERAARIETERVASGRTYMDTLLSRLEAGQPTTPPPVGSPTAPSLPPIIQPFAGGGTAPAGGEGSTGGVDALTRAAESAGFGRAKDRIGLLTARGVSDAEAEMAARGLSGSTGEASRLAAVEAAGVGQLGEASRDIALGNVARAQDIEDRNIAAQRETQAMQYRAALEAILGGYQGQITQRQQDIAGAEARRQPILALLQNAGRLY